MYISLIKLIIIIKYSVFNYMIHVTTLNIFRKILRIIDMLLFSSTSCKIIRIG